MTSTPPKRLGGGRGFAPLVGLALAGLTLATAATGRRTVVQTDRESLVDGRPVRQTQRDVITEQEPPRA